MGDLGGVGNIDGIGAAARFGMVWRVASQRTGDIYVYDALSNAIRRVSASGSVETVAGGSASSGSVDGTGSAASFGQVVDIAVDANGNVYVATDSEATIRRVTPSGQVSTYAGLTGSPGAIDGFRTEARFTQPTRLAFDAGGNLHVFDFPSVRKITPSGQVSTVFSAQRDASGAVSADTAGLFFRGGGAVIDAGGNYFVADTFGSVILRLTPTGVVSTWAGSRGVRGAADGLGTDSRFSFPTGITIDAAGNLYVGDNGNHTIRKITSAGVVSTLAGSAGVRGFADGSGGQARFLDLDAGMLAFGPGDQIYVGDGSTLRAVSLAGVVSTLAGSVLRTGQVDGVGTTARFGLPTRLAADSSGVVYALDQDNLNLRKLTPTGTVSTLSALPATTRRNEFGFYIPRGGIAIDAAGNLYLGDRPNYTVVKVTPSGAVSVFAGMVDAGGKADGMGAAARFSDPGEVAIDATGQLYVADGAVIRKITPDGRVSTLEAGAPFEDIVGLAVTGDGRWLYLTERRSHAIRRVEVASGAVSMFAGNTDIAGEVDGIGAAARFRWPSALCVDAADRLYVADWTTVRRITPSRSVSRLVGVPGKTGFLPGALPGVISNPRGLVVVGNALYISMDAGVVVVRDLT